MTKNTLAAALMVGVAFAIAGMCWLAVNAPIIIRLAFQSYIVIAVVLIVCCAWVACKDAADDLIARWRERGEGPK